MIIDIRFFPRIKCQIPEHIRVTRSLLGDTGTITFTFKNVKFLIDNINCIETVNQLEVKTYRYTYSTKDIRILWANGKPCILQAVFVIDSRELFDDFFQNLQAYSFHNGLTFFHNDEILENLGK